MCACIFLRCGSESHCFIPLPSSMTWPSTKRINSAKQERSWRFMHYSLFRD
jgi:hypothetical protein